MRRVGLGGGWGRLFVCMWGMLGGVFPQELYLIWFLKENNTALQGCCRRSETFLIFQCLLPTLYPSTLCSSLG